MTTQEIQQQITTQAAAAGVPAALALAIAQQESGFNPNAINTGNSNGTADYGVFQINSTNLASLGLTPASALDPTQNIAAGVNLLAQLQSRYGTDTASILSAYNTGSPNNTGSAYVSSVTSLIPQFGDGGTGSGGADLYTSVSALPDDAASGYVIDLSGIGLGEVTLTPGVIAGVGIGLVALLLLMHKNK